MLWEQETRVPDLILVGEESWGQEASLHMWDLSQTSFEWINSSNIEPNSNLGEIQFG